MNKLKNNQIIVLEILSWQGISVGAEHFYGYLNYTDSNGKFKKEKVTFPMSQEEADYLNKKDGFGSNWQAGEPNDRYMKEDALTKDAIKLFHEKLEPQGYKMLVEGDYAIAQPQRVIAYSQDVKDLAQKFNELYEQGNVIDWDWDVDKTDLLDNLCNQWNECINHD